MTETATNLLSSALNDPEEPFTSEMEETAVSVTGCLKNVLQSASSGSHSDGKTQENQSSSKVV